MKSDKDTRFRSVATDSELPTPSDVFVCQSRGLESQIQRASERIQLGFWPGTYKESVGDVKPCDSRHLKSRLRCIFHMHAVGLVGVVLEVGAKAEAAPMVERTSAASFILANLEIAYISETSSNGLLIVSQKIIFVFLVIADSI